MVRVEDDKGEMPLHKICRHGNIKCVRAVLEASEKAKKGSKVKDLNMGDRQGKTPLMIAAEYKHHDLVMHLLDSGASLKNENSHGWNIMHVIVNTNDRDLVQKFLLHPHVTDQNKALFNAPDKDARSPMHIAAFKCDEDIVGILASAGANVTTTDNSGNSPMKLAEKTGRRKSREIMEECLQANSARRASISAVGAMQKLSTAE